MRSLLLAAILALLPAGALRSQTTAPARLAVESSVAGVRVYLDSTFIGTAPVADSAVVPGVHLLRFVHPAGNLWIHPASVETLAVAPGSSIVRTAWFARWCHITSEPFGASVRAGDSLLGETPLYARTDGLNGPLTLALPGFADAVMPLPDSAGELHALLVPAGAAAAPPRSPFLSYEESKNNVPLIAAAGATLLTGVAAAWTKIRADEQYGEYQQNGSTATLNNVRRLDTASGLSLVASQVSLLVLGYLLFSR